MTHPGQRQDDPFGDPRLVALYDRDNPDGPDHDFYRALADELDAHTIVDLGCGTGILTVTLARPGRTVIGIDPSTAMLDYARRRVGASLVRWALGDARVLAGTRAELVIMSGNVAQHILGAAWPAALRGVHDALRPGDTLAFESRNPSARAWQDWTEERTRSTRDTEYGPLTEWLHVTDFEAGQLSFCAHTVFESTGEHLTSTARLAFRTQEQLDADLAAAGLIIHSVAGGWTGQPLGVDSPLIVVTARRPRVV